MRRASVCIEGMTSSSVSEFATADDFQKLFASEIVDLFRLAFLLTADAEKAEHCVILTIHECLATVDAFKAWLPVLTRNALIRNGIRIVTGIPARSLGKGRLHQPFREVHNSLLRRETSITDESAGILEMSDFDRLVYVLCSLEHYSTRDCAALLGRSRQEVRDAQNRGVGQIVEFEREWRRTPDGASTDNCLPPNQKQTDLDGSCANLLA
jgi:DNA-directed RNA polymerase specialized sigma24 family protein